LGIHLPKEARILDFGCGAGRTIQALRRLGYVNTEGYDVTDGRTLLRTDPEHIKTGTLLNLTLPYEDASFDLIISDQVFEHVQDQVRTFAELYRITKAGGHGLHIFPARYAPLEGHIFVPFGGVFQHRWYYKFWAAMGIRNEYQKGMTADQTADHNAQFAVDATRYIPASCYRAVWKDIGFEQRFSEQQFFDGHERPSMRLIGKGGGLTAWLYRTFRSRVVYLHKP
jgi:SAM-dependent methyltransferase